MNNLKEEILNDLSSNILDNLSSEEEMIKIDLLVEIIDTYKMLKGFRYTHYFLLFMFLNIYVMNNGNVGLLYCIGFTTSIFYLGNSHKKYYKYKMASKLINSIYEI